MVRTIKWSRMPRPYHGDPTKLISTSLKSSVKLVDLCFFFMGKQECIKEKEYIYIEEANQRVGGAAQADLWFYISKSIHIDVSFGLMGINNFINKCIPLGGSICSNMIACMKLEPAPLVIVKTVHPQGPHNGVASAASWCWRVLGLPVRHGKFSLSLMLIHGEFTASCF